MRDLVKNYLRGSMSRRSFVRRSSALGFSLAATHSVVSALQPLRAADTTPFTGTGGELLAEQLRALGTRFLFVCNSSGMGALCDALVDRPDLQFIQGVSEHQVLAMADGFAKATGRASFACFSRVDRKSTRLNSSHIQKSRMPSSA